MPVTIAVAVMAIRVPTASVVVAAPMAVIAVPAIVMRVDAIWLVVSLPSRRLGGGRKGRQDGKGRGNDGDPGQMLQHRWSSIKFT
jgi:hypothetical protein